MVGGAVAAGVAALGVAGAKAANQKSFKADVARVRRGGKRGDRYDRFHHSPVPVLKEDPGRPSRSGATKGHFDNFVDQNYPGAPRLRPPTPVKKKQHSKSHRRRRKSAEAPPESPVNGTVVFTNPNVTQSVYADGHSECMNSLFQALDPRKTCPFSLDEDVPQVESTSDSNSCIVCMGKVSVASRRYSASQRCGRPLWAPEDLHGLLPFTQSPEQDEQVPVLPPASGFCLASLSVTFILLNLMATALSDISAIEASAVGKRVRVVGKVVASSADSLQLDTIGGWWLGQQ
ncbi:MAG: hypothetical protein KVP17_002291 [Porospora cf. gigantea B]|uniref:uncharacterized protein n=1 Tax=Porospora cf. gigantea B TaxID=2853592 RepID=UPI003571A69E|nr:MAG: hypothetical protein KVP17_002291 [Porospora cf. gigantea B]